MRFVVDITKGTDRQFVGPFHADEFRGIDEWPRLKMLVDAGWQVQAVRELRLASDVLEETERERYAYWCERCDTGWKRGKPAGFEMVNGVKKAVCKECVAKDPGEFEVIPPKWEAVYTYNPNDR